MKSDRNNDHFLADMAGHRVVAQIRLAGIRPSARSDSFDDFMFPDAFLHGASPSSDASFWRARNNSTFMLVIFTPIVSAISPCDMPSAYASQRASRSRGLSLAIAEAMSVRR